MELNNLQKIKIKELRDEIFNRFELSAPWLFTQLENKTKKDLEKAVYKMISRYSRK
jgi:hypothetical protein